MLRKNERSHSLTDLKPQPVCVGTIMRGSSLLVLLLTVFFFPLLASTEQSRSVEVTGLHSEKVNALDFGEARALVFIFVSTDCPISNSYAPEYRRLASEYTTNGISFRLVYPNADETVDDVRKHLKEYNLPITAFRDPKHELVNAAQARVTPEAAVYLRG
ncbi:MAG TPA: redoxin family protein, partial [Verrucomicrobiae bacterium]|nr:redoxin family protein [Verrucomicrobiae bacterium]